jgi:hypothetical protein
MRIREEDLDSEHSKKAIKIRYKLTINTPKLNFRGAISL